MPGTHPRPFKSEFLGMWSRNLCACVYTHTHTHTHITVCVIMEAGKPKICSMDQEARDPGEPMVQVKSEGSLLKNFWESVFFLKSKG